jgi:hypothetical protein
MAEDERLNIVSPQSCCYCGSKEHLAADHLIPRKKGGANAGDNVVWACRPCNSSTGAMDALEWLAKRQDFPPLLLLRHYLKLAIEMSITKGIMDTPLSEAPEVPFTLSTIPLNYPPRET